MKISTEKLSNSFLELNSCGREFLTDKDYTTLRLNGRVDYHILYITRGLCTTEFDGQIIQVGAGNLILFKPYEQHKYSFKAKDNSISCYMHFSGTECHNLLNEFGLLQNHVTYVGTNNKLESIFSEMEHEYLLKRPFYTETCAALLLRFLSTAGRLYRYINEEINTKTQSDIDAVCKHMHEHYSKNHNMQFYADMCHLSASRFSHAFKEYTGTSPKNYLINIRISIARKLLETTDLSIADVAGIVGIEDVNYFSRIVKKVTGHSPKYFKA